MLCGVHMPYSPSCAFPTLLFLCAAYGYCCCVAQSSFCSIFCCSLFLLLRLPVPPSSCYSVFLFFCLPVPRSSLYSVFLFPHLPVILSSCYSVFLFTRLPVILSSCYSFFLFPVFLLFCLLALPSSFFSVFLFPIFPFFCLPVPQSSCYSVFLFPIFPLFCLPVLFPPFSASPFAPVFVLWPFTRHCFKHIHTAEDLTAPCFLLNCELRPHQSALLPSD